MPVEERKSSEEKIGAVRGDEARGFEKKGISEADEDESEDAPALDPGRFRLSVFSRCASTRFKLRLSRPCWVL